MNRKLILDIIVLLIKLKLISVSSISQVQSTPCIPMESKTAISIGQDYFSVLNYTHNFPGSPFATMTYTALRSDTGNLAGLKLPVDYGSGVEWAQGLVNKYNTSSLQIGLWLVGSCEDIKLGLLDKEINKLGTFFLSIMPIDVYLRIGYEFDSAENDYDTNSYIQAFQYIVNHLRRMGVTNVAYVWHSYSETPRDGLVINDWYE